MSNCRSCSAEIRWARTSNGKAMPVDIDPHEDGNLVLGDKFVTVYANAATAIDAAPDALRYLSHFATCPTAFEHRRVRR